MAQYTKYITKQGDRWDTIAYKAYGIATKIKPIMDANKTVSRKPVLDAGIELLIPIIDEAVIKGNNDVPPWKESDVIDNGFQEDQNSEIVEESRINESANPARYRLINSNGRQLTEGVITAGTIGEVKSPDAYISFNGGEPVPVATGETHDITAPPAHVILKDTGGEVLDEVDAPSGEDKEVVAPDGVANVYDQNDNLLASEIVMSGEIKRIDVVAGGSTFTRPPFNTMQAGDTAIGQDFFILPQPNHFGHNWRFTGITGGYYDRNTSQYKDVNGNVTTRLLAYPNDLRCDWATLNENNEFYLWHLDNEFTSGMMLWVDAVDYCDTLTIGTFVGFNMPSFQDFMTLYQVNNSLMFSIPELLIATASVGWWTRTEIPYNSGNVVYNVLNDYRVFAQAKTTINAYSRPLPVRLTNVSELP